MMKKQNTTGSEMTFQQAYEKLAALCARGEHCQYEMHEKLRQWGFDETQRSQIIARLVSERYVDDERYTKAFVNDKIRYNHWGRRKVEQALWAKHIDDALVREVLDDIDDAAYVDILRPMLRQKRKSTTAKNDYELNMKLMKWAIGRGFTMDIIRQCITVDNDESEFPDEDF